MTRIRTGFPFHSPSFTIDIEKTAKHLTTSPTMLTAANALGKLQNAAPIHSGACRSTRASADPFGV
jgi:hypothetical protein